MTLPHPRARPVPNRRGFTVKRVSAPASSPPAREASGFVFGQPESRRESPDRGGGGGGEKRERRLGRNRFERRIRTLSSALGSTVTAVTRSRNFREPSRNVRLSCIMRKRTKAADRPSELEKARSPAEPYAGTQHEHGLRNVYYGFYSGHPGCCCIIH